MINLLPPEVKQGYHFARRNVSLRKWVLICLVAFVGLGAIATYGMLTIHQSTVHYNDLIADNTASLKKQDFDGVQKQVEDISSSFKLVVKVLGQEILFSQLLTQLGTVMPAGSQLTDLSIAQTVGSLEISANAVDYATATQVQVNLADPANKIFNKADIESISCFSGSADPALPCSVRIRALFATNNPFLFINSKAKP
jgi:Tfp pilus assembly protein PilN